MWLTFSNNLLQISGLEHHFNIRGKYPPPPFTTSRLHRQPIPPISAAILKHRNHTAWHTVVGQKNTVNPRGNNSEFCGFARCGAVSRHKCIEPGIAVGIICRNYLAIAPMYSLCQKHVIHLRFSCAESIFYCYCLLWWWLHVFLLRLKAHMQNEKAKKRRRRGFILRWRFHSVFRFNFSNSV